MVKSKLTHYPWHDHHLRTLPARQYHAYMRHWSVGRWVRRLLGRPNTVDRIHEIAERVEAETAEKLARAEARLRARWPEDGVDPVYRWYRGSMLTMMDFFESGNRLSAAGREPKDDPDFYRRLFLLETCQPIEMVLGQDYLQFADDEVATWAPELGHPVNGIDAAARAHLLRYFRLCNPDASEAARRAIHDAIRDGVAVGVQRAIMRQTLGSELEQKMWESRERAVKEENDLRS